MRSTAKRASFVLLFVALASVGASPAGSTVWFNQRVTWEAGLDPRPWETAVVSPTGKEHYRLALVPLWAVEGGIVAIEILVARPERPDHNLLGRRKSHVPQRFVLTVEELERGINKSRFGAIRVFHVGRVKLRVGIEGSRLGRGVGECEDCPNIQELTAQFSFGPR